MSQVHGSHQPENKSKPAGHDEIEGRKRQTVKGNCKK